jgi:urease accessory protein
VVVVRALADRIEPVAALLREVWSTWRQAAWALPACPPRVWAT